MSQSVTFSLTTHLLAFVMFLQAIEIFSVVRNPLFARVWVFENTAINLKIISVIQLILSISGFFLLNGYIFIGLFATHLLICLRFRGSFNGGSDMMTFVLVTGVLISFFGPHENSINLGLIYVGIHIMYSYIKAGIVKARRPEWRTGEALPEFLSHSLFIDVQKFSKYLSTHKPLSKILGITAVLFELSIVILPFFPKLILPYFLIALLFHFFIYIAFGLNRFLWAWLTAWPAVIYSLQLIHM